ncbi:CBS domain-containing protein [Albibacterium bauzanense]|uniref:CBS domain protein n=1 Tax=Albibacterium bauzanense TaxID=653929 RepID=A0A4R1LXA6_9SPHI|nr:CBS domain-containing protein [Albibacterium bauzanense]TCK83542.1 CBS domain protein [Albibacterium bauzanense]
MTAKEIVSNSIYPAKTSDSLRALLSRMQEYRVEHLPLIRYNQLVGLIHEDDVIAAIDRKDDSKLKDLPHELIYIYENQHIYDVVRLFYIHQLDILPVIDEKQYYVGCITIHDVLNEVAMITTSDEPGGIIILEVNNRDNSLSQIAQIVESDNAQIMSSYARSFPDSTRMEITLKLNRTDIASIVASFLRYDYEVKATFNDVRVYDTSRDRYEQLLNYLNM